MRKSNSYGLKAAVTAAARIDSLLLGKGMLRNEIPKVGLLPTPGKGNDLYTTELEINDTPLSARNLLTKGQTQDEISQFSGAAISTRGRYMTQVERSQNPTDRALYLFIQGPTKQSLDMAIQRITDIIRLEQNLANQRIIRQKPQLPPPLMSIQTNLTSVDKVMVGLDHAPASFDLRSRVIGSGGANLEYIRSETGAVVTLRGRGSLFMDTALGAESPEPMHLFIEHPRYDGLMAARQLALNLIETMQQELSQFQQVNPPSVAPASVPNIVQNVQGPPGHLAHHAQNQAYQNVLQQQQQQVFTQLHQPIAIPPPVLAVPPPVQIPQQLQPNMMPQQQQTITNIIQPSMMQQNIMQPAIQQNIMQHGMLHQNMLQQQGMLQHNPQLLMQQSPGIGVNNNNNNNMVLQQPPPQLNLPPPGVHIPTQQGPLVPSNSQPQQLILSQPPPTLTLPPPSLPAAGTNPLANGQLVIVSSAQNHYSQQPQHPQMFVSQQAAPGAPLNQGQPYQYHIIHQGGNPIYTMSQNCQQQPNDPAKPNNQGPQFQTMTLQQVYHHQPQQINAQTVLPSQEQFITQSLPNGQQYIVSSNTAPIYIVPPPAQRIQSPLVQQQQFDMNTQHMLQSHLQHQQQIAQLSQTPVAEMQQPVNDAVDNKGCNNNGYADRESPRLNQSPVADGSKDSVEQTTNQTNVEETGDKQRSSESPAYNSEQAENIPRQELGTPHQIQAHQLPLMAPNQLQSHFSPHMHYQPQQHPQQMVQINSNGPQFHPDTLTVNPGNPQPQVNVQFAGNGPQFIPNPASVQYGQFNQELVTGQPFTGNQITGGGVHQVFSPQTHGEFVPSGPGQQFNQIGPVGNPNTGQPLPVLHNYTFGDQPGVQSLPAQSSNVYGAPMRAGQKRRIVIDMDNWRSKQGIGTLQLGPPVHGRVQQMVANRTVLNHLHGYAPKGELEQGPSINKDEEPRYNPEDNLLPQDQQLQQLQQLPILQNMQQHHNLQKLSPPSNLQHVHQPQHHAEMQDGGIEFGRHFENRSMAFGSRRPPPPQAGRHFAGWQPRSQWMG